MSIVRALFALVVAAFVLAGCGGSSSSSNESGDANAGDVLKQLEGLSPQQREQKLSTLAKQEGGKLTLYTSMNTDTSDPIVSAFEDLYDVDVALYSASGDTILARILEEEKAGFHGSDVVQMNALGTINLHDEGLLADYAPPSPDKLIPDTRFGDWTAYQIDPLVLAWNTKLVEGADVPRSWEDLADPRWKGQVGIEAEDVDVYKTLHDVWSEQGKSEAEINELFEAIGDNAIVIRGHALLAELHAADEYALSINYAHRLDQSIEDGAPLAWRPAVEPLIVEPQGMAVMRDTTHPAAAALFADWMLGPGQKIFLEHHRYPVSRSDAVDFGARQVVVDFADLAKDQERWRDAFEDMLSRGRPGPDG
ncbi:MAG: extracellular solute-binding protein [Actinomycetota bacterium]|nr:extracellular solute-binding protein [Actinomycetota bacterium]